MTLPENDEALSESELDAAWSHYSGNCFSCERCTLFEAVRAGTPGAVAAYRKHMAERSAT